MEQIERPLITKVGLEKLKAELYQRENVKKQSLVSTLISSKEAGDERENDGFSLAFEDFQINEQRILDLKETIKFHQLVIPKQNNFVELGHKIILKDLKGKERILQLVPPIEVDPFLGKISDKSQIGEMLLKKTVGTKIVLGGKLYKIIKIVTF